MNAVFAVAEADDNGDVSVQIGKITKHYTVPRTKSGFNYEVKMKLSAGKQDKLIRLSHYNRRLERARDWVILIRKY